MPLSKKFWMVALLALLPLAMTASSLFGQMENEMDDQGRIESQQTDLFQWPLPLDSSETSEEQNAISESTFTEEAPPATYPKGEPLEEKTSEELPPFSPQEKRTVEVPEFQDKPFVDAGDFRDPFFPVRGFQNDSPRVLKPGVTVDGLQFFSYTNSNPFIENFYRNTNFSLKHVFGKVVQLESGRGCLHCHNGIEEISPNHKFRCTQCHGGNRRAKSLPQAHKNLVANPSDLDHAAKFCGKCHAEEIAKVEQSSMTTAKGIINTTRYAWGAQSHAEGIYSLRPKTEVGESPLPSAEGGHPVDALLRTKCLRCHVQGQSPHRSGDYRATGCASCHMIYGNDGLTLTRDRAIQSRQQNHVEENKTRFQQKSSSQPLKNKRGYPVMHKFTLAIPSVQCEHCHNANGVGNEFEGLLRKPARPQLEQSKADSEKPVLYGSEHEFLTPDIHRERGMHCIDCHGINGIKGSSSSPDLHSKVAIRCEDCHGTHSREPDEFLLVQSDPNTKEVLNSVNRNPNLRKKIRPGNIILVNSEGTRMPHIKRDKKQWVLYSKVTGKKHVIPILKNIKRPAAHQVTKHMASMECHTCHARWSASDWGMHLIKEPSLNLEKWKSWNFSDPTLQQLLSQENPQDAPGKMLDWLTATSSPNGIEGTWIDGLWWNVLTETSWQDMILGKNARGKYTVMKPRYQYFLTERTADNQTPEKRGEVLKTVDGRPGLILVPHTPHTIRTTARSCESCHENNLAMGLGNPLKRSVLDGKLFFNEFYKNNRLLPEFQLKQVVTDKGTVLQTAVPPGKTRFLKTREIDTLAKKSNSYRAFRYLNLRKLGYPRLLMRNEFPYDIRHQANEKNYGSPSPVEDLYYDFEKNQFFASGTSLEDILKKRARPSESPTEQPFDEQPDFQIEIEEERPFDIHEPLAGQQPLESFPESPDSLEPPKEQTLEEEGNSIIEFFQGIFEEGSNPPSPVEPDQPPLTE
ncbi:MAG: hypothetical protein NPINA01_26940 [Nitrospinaceae bacterium]|nr:MAG: hypothetical protein NPINA01_26940 [Nitrospinaceae bacterium]